MKLSGKLHFLSYLLLFTLVFGFEAQAQRNGERQMEEEAPYQSPDKPKASIFRTILNKVTVGVYTGYGFTQYRQKLDGASILQRNGNQYLFTSTGGTVNTSYQNWLNDPQSSLTVVPGPQDELVSSDTTSLSMTGGSHSLPFGLSLHGTILDRVRLGGGIELSVFSVNALEYNEGAQDVLNDYDAGIKSALTYRFYGLVGARAWRWYEYDFVPELRIGKNKFINQFANDKIDQSLIANLGLSIEKNYSELFRLVLRPSLEWSSYTMNLSGSLNTNSSSEAQLTTQTPAFQFQAGISFNYPRLPRCPINRCHIQLEHVHFGKEYRGQPIYRWQNPKYGQNHPIPERIKRKKKRGKAEKERSHKPKRRRKFLFFKWLN